MALLLEQRLVDEMVRHATEDPKNEICGVIAGRDGRGTKLYRIRNAEPDEYRPVRYNMDGLQLKAALQDMDKDDAEVLVIYHSHIATEAYPSPTDIRMSQWPGSKPPIDLYPDAYYVLVSLMYDPPAVRAFKIHEGKVEEEAIEVDG